jgi:hypothetical protein
VLDKATADTVLSPKRDKIDGIYVGPIYRKYSSFIDEINFSTSVDILNIYLTLQP